tara:strand:- start:977 stop:1498 length:522 start_codon:yes stop_codon:yes gene_type:complete
MTLWGTKDTVYSDGTIAISGKTVTGTGTTFTTAGITTGAVITVGTAASVGEAIVASVTNNTTLVLHSTQHFTYDGVVSGESYEIREKPISTIVDTNYGATEIFGVDTTEIGIANTATAGSEARKFAPTHAGWVGITTYNDHLGNLRIKSEVLVASSSITGDSGDDTIFPDVAS